MKQVKTAEEILEGITPYSVQGYPLLYDAVDVRNAMRIVYEQFKPEWYRIDEFLPAKTGKVRWKYEDGTIDIGYYSEDTKEFATYDPLREQNIVEWQYLTEQPLPSLPNQ